MPNEVTIVLKNLVIKGNAVDDKGSFKYPSSGDVKVTADPTTVLAMAEYLEEVLADEA